MAAEVPRVVASLPMYEVGDHADIVAATDVWWACVARHLKRITGKGEREGISVPTALERVLSLDDVLAARESESTDTARVLLSQTCGFPLCRDTVQAKLLHPVATPRYSAPGCAGYEYCSGVVVNAASTAASLAALRGCTAAVNSTDSMSGYLLLRAAVATEVLAHGDATAADDGRETSFFSKVLVTGAHMRSLAAVASGAADVAAIDAVTLALARKHGVAAADVAAVRVLCYTPRAPGLPLCTTEVDEVDNLKLALRAAADDPSPEAVAAREALLMESVEDAVPREAYELRIADLESLVARSGIDGPSTP